MPIDSEPQTGRARQRSYTIHGTSLDAEKLRARLLTPLHSWPDQRKLPPAAVITVAELLAAWLAADHPWKPSTVVGYRSTVKGRVGVDERILRSTRAGLCAARPGPAAPAASR